MTEVLVILLVVIGVTIFLGWLYVLLRPLDLMISVSEESTKVLRKGKGLPTIYRNSLLLNDDENEVIRFGVDDGEQILAGQKLVHLTGPQMNVDEQMLERLWTLFFLYLLRRARAESKRRLCRFRVKIDARECLPITRQKVRASVSYFNVIDFIPKLPNVKVSKETFRT